MNKKKVLSILGIVVLFLVVAITTSFLSYSFYITDDRGLIYSGLYKTFGKMDYLFHIQDRNNNEIDVRIDNARSTCTQASDVQKTDNGVEVESGYQEICDIYLIGDSINYSVNFVLGSNATWKSGYSVPSSYEYGTGLTLPTSSNLTLASGYEFEGWYKTEDFSGESFTQIYPNSIGNRTYYAKIVKKSYSVTFVLGSNATWKSGYTAPTEYTAETGLTLPTASNLTINSEFIFNGWYDNASFTGNPVTSISTSATGDKVYYAKVDRNVYRNIFRFNFID